MPKITAIVIDDDKDTVKVFSEYLQIMGIRVVGKGYDGQDAIDMYKKFSPDVAFLDIMMDKYDGIYGLEKIKEIQPDAIVIMVTADLTRETEEKVTRLGASAIIYKPYDIDRVVQIVRKLTTAKMHKDGR